MKTLLTLFAFLCIFTLFAQQTEGIITYEQVVTINMDRFPPEVRSAIPPERKSTSQLIFNQQESIYQPVKNQNDINEDVSAGNNRRRFRMRRGDNNEFYNNLETGESISKNEFFDRIFLIEGDEKIVWKITSEMKMVGKYQCIQATSMRDTIPVVAWFTPQIPVSTGPGEFKGLPGVILRVESGRRKITATNLDLRALTQDEVIVVPEKGKKVTREEYREIVRSKMEEMREANGGGGGRRVIIRN